MKALITLLFTSLSLAAQTNLQHYSYAFTNAPLWDITGPVERTENFSTITGSVVLHADGQITGARTEVYDHNGDHLEGSAFIQGRLFSTATGVQFRDQWQGTYSGFVSGRAVTATAKAHGTGVLIPSTLSVQENSSSRVCIFGGKCDTGYDGYELHLPPGMDGTWWLATDFGQIGNKLMGQATLTLSTGRTFTYQLTGTQNPKRGTAVLRLKGINDAAKSSFTLNTSVWVTKVQGRLLGQKLNTQLTVTLQ
jgi:hypothetical protein